MQALLIAARALHFAAVISLSGVFAFECLVAGPAFQRSGLGAADAAPLRRRLQWLVWASLALLLASGAGWLVAISSEMSGKPLGVALAQGAVTTVLTRTRFGEDWLLRLAFAGLLAMCLVAGTIRRARLGAVLGWARLVFAALMLATLAWAGHGAATPGPSGDFHLAADILHLLAAGLWLGTLPPLALLLAAARLDRNGRWAFVVRIAILRFSTLAVTSVAVLLASGLVNTWFLAGTVPALVGTEYGHLLLGKIALFLVMLAIAAVYLLRLTPRLATAALNSRDIVLCAVAHLRRNALLEATIGLVVLGIVGALGILPPGLHTEPGWPFPFRLEIETLTVGSQILLAALAAVSCVCVVAAVVSAAAGHYRRTAALAGGLLLCLVLGWFPLRPAIEPAYPTSFFAPAEPYDAASVARGAALYAEDCALCHGASGRGNGPAAASLPIRPANLLEPHLFAHSPGDLFWWVSHGRDNGVMPGFAGILKPSQRWDVINFIRARAAGALAGQIGPEVATAGAPEVPDFAFESEGEQKTLRRMLEKGPVLLVLFAPPAPAARLEQLTTAQPRFRASGLHVIAVGLGASPEENPDAGQTLPFVVNVAPEVSSALALFREIGDGGDTELLVDRAENVRACWQMLTGMASPATLIADAERVAQIAVAAPSHAGHTH